jgi:hypothetical protein
MITNGSEIIESYEQSFDALMREAWSGGRTDVAEEEESEWTSGFMRAGRRRVGQSQVDVSMPGEQAIRDLPE